jgi:phage terminase large subunit GpA-like protein
MTLLPERKITLPRWLPAAQRERLAGRRITLCIPRGVRARLRTPERIPPSDWNERYRVMGASESFPGKWRRDIAPHAARVMDTWALPWVREVVFCGPDQASKTSAMLGCLGWSIDQNPGNIFYTASNEDKTKEIVNDKLIPMLRESPRLRKRLSKRSDDTGMSKIRMNNGVTIRVAWANSPASTASFSARDTYNDEVDKWQLPHIIKQDGGKSVTETSPVRRIRKRAKNYPLTHKHFWASTPAGRYIHKMLMACQQVWDYACRCPDCVDLIIMDEDHLVTPQGATEEIIKANPEAVEYACNSCGSSWDEEKRLQAYREGDFVCIKGDHVSRPVDVGFHLSGFATPDMRMADIACTIVSAKAGDLAAKIDLAHGIKAIDYKEEATDRKEDTILRLRDSRPEGLVPADTFALLMTADTQDNGFWYKVRAWTYGEGMPSALVKSGFVTTKEALEEILFGEYRDAASGSYRMTYAGIDTRGHRTAEIYAWCKRTNVMALLGAPGRKAQPVTVSRIEFYPGTNKPIDGGLTLYHFDTHYHKDHLVNKLRVEPSDPGAFLLHSGYTSEQLEIMAKMDGPPPPHNLQAYASHFCAEIRDERGLWQNPTKRANHLFDCEVMGLAIAMYLGFQNVTRPEETSPPPDEGPRVLSGGV